MSTPQQSCYDLKQIVEDLRKITGKDYTAKIVDSNNQSKPTGQYTQYELPLNQAPEEETSIGFVITVKEKDRFIKECEKYFEPGSVRLPGDRVRYSQYHTALINAMVYHFCRSSFKSPRKKVSSMNEMREWVSSIFK